MKISKGTNAILGRIKRPDQSLIVGFRGVGTSTIGNVLDDMGIKGVMLNMRPIALGMKFVGPAFTVKETAGVHGTYAASEFGLGAVIDQAEAGDVIAIDNNGQQVSTWGGIASFAAMKKDINGLIVDGGVRDADEILEFGFSVFSRYVVPLSGKTRVKVVSVNSEIEIDGVRVGAGDILVGDSTGVVCVPIDAAPRVLEDSQKLETDDRQAIKEIDSGLSFTEALSKFTKL
jgi:regulator of RNase E activity RraA